MDSFVIKTPLKNNISKYIIINTIWKDTSFILYVLKDNVAFNCQVTTDDLKKFSEVLKQPFEKYVNELKSIFNELNKNTEKYFFLFDSNNELKIQFSVGNEGLKQKYAGFKLEKTNYNKAIESIIDTLLNNREELKNDLIQLNCKNIDIEAENRNLKLEMQNKSEELDKQEKELLSKFVLLLNEKKDRISQLYEIIEDRLSAHECPCQTKINESNKKNTKPVKRICPNESVPTPSTSKDSLTSTPTKVSKPLHNMSDSDNDATESEKEESQKNSLDTQELFGDDEEWILPKRIKVDEPLATFKEDDFEHVTIKRNPDSLELQFEVDDFVNDL